MLKIIPIPAFHDNYIWLITDTAINYAVAVDPGDSKPVLATLEALQLELSAILLTHHHADHSGGVKQLTKLFPVPVFGPQLEAKQQVTHPVKENDNITLPNINTTFQVFDIPGHTAGHIAFYHNQHKQPMLFCGDTLFACGCGRLFEGTAKQMYHSLQKLAQLPPSTHVYCGHEYTAANIAFALQVEPNNQALLSYQTKVKALRAEDKPTLPSTIKLELETNPFLRCHKPTVKQSAEHYAQKPLNDPIEIFAALRIWKDTY